MSTVAGSSTGTGGVGRRAAGRGAFFSESATLGRIASRPARMLKIHETNGTTVHLDADADGLTLVLADGRFPLPKGSLAAVLRRFGSPFDPAQPVMEIGTLQMPEGVLRHVRHKDTWDVIARDWLVLDDRCALATTVAGALEHLGRANRVD